MTYRGSGCSATACCSGITILCPTPALPRNPGHHTPTPPSVQGRDLVAASIQGAILFGTGVKRPLPIIRLLEGNPHHKLFLLLAGVECLGGIQLATDLASAY